MIKTPNYSLILLMAGSFVICLVITILSSMSATKNDQQQYSDSHTYATWSSILAGIASFALFVAGFIYLYRTKECIAADILRGGICAQ